MKKGLWLIGIAALAMQTSAAFGQNYQGYFQPNYNQGYYQPRVYNSPAPVQPRSYYEYSGRALGTGAGYAATMHPYAQPFRQPATRYGGTIGEYGMGQAYDYQYRYNTQRHYYPSPYGVQSTTPYYQRTIPRY